MDGPTDALVPPAPPGRAPELPPGVLIQSVLVDAHGGESGYRIYADGRYEAHPHGQPWTFGRSLTDAQMAAVRDAIAAARLDTLQSYYPVPTADDVSTLWFQVVGPSATATTIAVETPRSVPEIDRLAGTLVAIFR